MNEIVLSKKIGIIVIVIGIIFVLSGCTGSESGGIEKTTEELSKVVLKNTPEANVGSVNGEWAVIGLWAAKAEVPEDFFEIYYDNVRAYVKSKEGILTKDTYTEYARISLALCWIGKDPTDVEGYNLIEPLDDFHKVVNQGINGAAYALITSNASGIKLKSEDKYIEYILENANKSGGFSVSGKYDESITAMVIQGLAPYKDRPEIKDVIEKALDSISESQNDDGTFNTGSETVSQVILALCAIGEDPLTNEMFIKNDMTLFDVLLTYKTDDGLAHSKGDEGSPMSTEQGLYAISQIKNIEAQK